jgi:hypothetical protein
MSKSEFEHETILVLCFLFNGYRAIQVYVRPDT